MKLLAALSGHGYGHVAQLAPVLNVLRERRPGLQLFIQGGCDPGFMGSRIHGRWSWIPDSPDVSVRMDGDLGVLREETLQAYEEFHRSWEEQVFREARRMLSLGIRAVIADVPYLPLEAAGRAGIPAAALCSLNWVEILEPLCRGIPGMAQILECMEEAYCRAQVFLRPEPFMPMERLPNTVDIGPVAQVTMSRRDDLVGALGVDPAFRVVLVQFGGAGGPMDPSRLPSILGVHWILPGGDVGGRGDCTSVRSLTARGWTFLEILASCDAMITKPGYNSFVEAACHAVPVAYVERRSWPEDPYLVRWMREHGTCVSIRGDLGDSASLAEALESLWKAEVRPPVHPWGVSQAAELLESLFFDA